LHAAVPPGSEVVIYKNMQEFAAPLQANKELDWIKHAVQNLPLVVTAPVAANRQPEPQHAESAAPAR
jgi:hypothetical protein